MSLVVEGSPDAHWHEVVCQAQDHSGSAAVVDGGLIRREQEFLGVAAKVIGDPGQLGMVEDSRPCHNCVLALICVMFAALERLHIRSSLSATTLDKA
jgi:hypothetical protein